MSTFKDELESVINRYSKENGSDTPDFILANYLTDCLEAFDRAVLNRQQWYGHKSLTHTGQVKVEAREVTKE